MNLLLIIGGLAVRIINPSHWSRVNHLSPLLHKVKVSDK